MEILILGVDEEVTAIKTLLNLFGNCEDFLLLVLQLILRDCVVLLLWVP